MITFTPGRLEAIDLTKQRNGYITILMTTHSIFNVVNVGTHIGITI